VFRKVVDGRAVRPRSPASVVCSPGVMVAGDLGIFVTTAYGKNIDAIEVIFV
jgi:hypothetical protein